jgi:hypothetical protein
MDAAQLRDLLGKMGLSQGSAAAALDLTERTFRRYVAGDTPIPRSVQMALLYLQSCMGSPVTAAAPSPTLPSQSESIATAGLVSRQAAAHSPPIPSSTSVGDAAPARSISDGTVPSLLGPVRTRKRDATEVLQRMADAKTRS